jgi:hypothetical protein
MGATTAAEIWGLEFDWLATDADRQVGFFTTAGGGYAPPEFLGDTDAHEAAIAAILALPPTTTARFAPVVGSGLRNDWRLMAERGVFAYDADANGGPYRLVAAPTDAILVETLPDGARQVVEGLRCPFGFEGMPTAGPDDLALLSSDIPAR